MIQLPHENFLEVCSYLDSRTLIQMVFVCKCYYEHLQDDSAWKSRCQREFGLTELKTPDRGWQSVYFNCYFGSTIGSIFAWKSIAEKDSNTQKVVQRDIPVNNFDYFYRNGISNHWSDMAMTDRYIYTLDISGRLWVRNHYLKYGTPLEPPSEIEGYKLSRIASCSSYCIGLTRNNTIYKISDTTKMDFLHAFPAKIRQIVALSSYITVLSNTGEICFVNEPVYDSKWKRKHAVFGVSLSDDPITQIAPVGKRIVALTTSGKVWLLRCENYLQFSESPRSNMTELIYFSGYNSSTITGKNNHFAVITKCGEVLLGDSEANSSTVPIKPSFLQNASIRSISFGNTFFGALNKAGEIITWRKNPNVDIRTPAELPPEEQPPDEMSDNERPRLQIRRRNWPSHGTPFMQERLISRLRSREALSAVIDSVGGGRHSGSRRATNSTPYKDFYSDLSIKWDQVSAGNCVITDDAIILAKNIPKETYPSTILVDDNYVIALGIPR